MNMAVITITNKYTGKTRKFETNIKKRKAQAKAKYKAKSKGSSSNKIVVTRADGKVEEKVIGAKGGYTTVKEPDKPTSTPRTTSSQYSRGMSTRDPNFLLLNRESQSSSSDSPKMSTRQTYNEISEQRQSSQYNRPTNFRARKVSKQEPRQKQVIVRKPGLASDIRTVIRGAKDYAVETTKPLLNYAVKATAPYTTYSLVKKDIETIKSQEPISTKIKELTLTNPLEVGKEAAPGAALIVGGTLLSVPAGVVGTTAQATALTGLSAYQLRLGGEKFVEASRSGDLELAGEAGVDLIGSVLTGGQAVSKTAQTISDLRITMGGKYIPPDEISANTNYPKTSSSTETIRRFESGEDILVHSSPNELRGSTPVVGEKGLKGFEDAGLYGTSAETGASTAFLGVDGGGSYSFNLQPMRVNKPTISLFKTKGVANVPDEILSQPGFKPTSSYAEKNIAPFGEVYVTKRSRIGQGEIKRQKWMVEEDIVSPFSDRNIPAGAKLWEAGTREEELVLPLTSKFIKSKNVLGSQKYYTKINGRPVQIKGYKTVKFEDVTTGRISQKDVSTAAKEVRIGSRDYQSGVIDRKLSISPSIVQIPYRSKKNGISSSTNDEISTTWKSPKELLSTNQVKDISKSNVSGREPFVPFSPSIPTLSPTKYPITPITSTGGSSGGGSYPTPPPPPTYVPDPYIPPPPTYTGGGSSGGGSSGFWSSSRYFSELPKYPKIRLPTQKKKKLFELFVKKKGKFIKFGKQLDLSTAVSRGKSIVGTSAAATFKIKDIGSGSFVKSFNIGQSFRSGKKSPFEFVEKRGSRIKSSGELREITFKGIASPKRRKKVRF